MSPLKVSIAWLCSAVSVTGPSLFCWMSLILSSVALSLSWSAFSLARYCASAPRWIWSTTTKGGAAAPEADEIVAARQHLERVRDKVAVARRRHDHLLAEELRSLRPEPVVQHVAIRDHDHVDRLLCLFDLRRLIGLGRVVLLGRV